MATIRFTIQMNCGVRPDSDTGLFVSFCPTLDVYSQGETEDEALDAIKSAISLRLSTALDHGKLERMLRKAGFREIRRPDGSLPETTSAEFIQVQHVSNEYKEVPIEVPLTLLVAQSQIPHASTH